MTETQAEWPAYKAASVADLREVAGNYLRSLETDMFLAELRLREMLAIQSMAEGDKAAQSQLETQIVSQRKVMQEFAIRIQTVRDATPNGQ